MLDPQRARYVDLENLCQDDYEYLTHTGWYTPLPVEAVCEYCQSTQDLGTLTTCTGKKVVVCESCAMSEGE